MHMKKIAKALAMTGSVLFALNGLHASAQQAPAAPAAAPTPEHTFVPKVSLYTEYEYRGISQTSEKPAVQLNLDYSHASGFYAGAFLTNIKWIEDTKKELQRANPPASQFIGGKGSVELDLFGGYKFEVVKDVTLDLGYLRYEYIGSEEITQKPLPTTSFLILKKPNTDEFYVGISSGAFSAKYSHIVSDAFGLPGTKGSSFAEINWSQEVMPKVIVNTHVGRATYKGYVGGNYTVFKVGATYDIGDGWNAGAYYKDTNANPAVYTYLGKDWSKGRLVAFVNKSF